MEPKKRENTKLLGLGKLKDKLLNLNPLYNRKIRFYVSERLAWDLSELLNKSDPELVNNFSISVLNWLNKKGEVKENISLNLEKFFQPLTPEEILKFQKKVIHLQRKNIAVYQEKGYKALFLGVFFLRGYFYNNSKVLRFINAPLFLLPCDLEKVKNLSLVFHSEKKINYNLLYYLQKELGLAKEKLSDFLNKLKNEKGIGEWENYRNFLAQEFQNLIAASSIKIIFSSTLSSLTGGKEKGNFLIEEETIKKPNASPFVKTNLTINNGNLIGQIVNKENKIVYQKGDYYGNSIYKLKIVWEESSRHDLEIPETIFVYSNLVSKEIIKSIEQNQFINKKYQFFCEKGPKRWVLRDWQEVENSLDYLPPNQELKRKHFQPELFVKLTLSNKPKNYSEDQLEIVLNFCLTIDSEPNLSLFRDFEEIIEEYSQDRVINWSKSALNLLRGEVESVISYPKQKEIDQQAKPLYIPFLSDPSQTRILKVIFHQFSQNTLCIDGPPGTGKSQLICNLLANSLAYQKKVLVVCEKEVALKVIYDKLSKIGLNHSIIKINELAQTPQIYREVLNHIKNNQQVRTNRYDYFNAKQIVGLEEKQASNLRKIANYCQVENEFRDNRQISLQQVYLKFNQKYQLSSALIQLNKDIQNKEQLDKTKSDLENYISKFNKIFSNWKPICLQLKNLFLESNFQNFEFNWENQNNFQEVINSLLRELRGEKTETSLLSRIWQIKLWGECRQGHQSVSLLETKKKDLEAIQKEHHYQKFFTFLQLANFADFWQKGSDEEFLLAIQQFISREFLAIGELHFLWTSFDENTKKNIAYLLGKILIDQEFNYLNNYSEIYEQSVYFNWIKEIEEKNKEVLANWNQEELTRIQREQQEISRKKKALVKLSLRNKQKENLNKLFANQALRNELSKKRKISSLKKTFSELVNYFPIWLATPEVIAAVTNRQEVSFDFLVFDEASQIPLEKSIPLWARAKKCIVIGDEQQLPPTDFFRSHLKDEEEEIWEEDETEEGMTNEAINNINLKIDDLEKNSNLLGYAKKYARNQEKLTLLYHYRSQYPELIDFSNQAFYNGILQIVSASKLRKKDDLPIEYHHVKGHWINTENQVEVRHITELLKTLPSNKEIGIITFNVKQRDLLADSIEETGNYKNLFIKNLEEVQGDERDIIIFSIGYGPNKEGKIFLNFGPLSNEGGEKRLNVAISRAREKMIIVTSLLPDDLKRITEEDENRKPGPKLFKKYLEYAYYCWKKETEKVQNLLEKSLPKIINTSLAEKSEEREEFGSLFEEQVYQQLIKLNLDYEIHQQVKSVGYRIDLAIWDSQIQQYILGIECDGEYWHGKLENIERDIYRQQLLENKGWKIIRILSRDWCRNKEGEIERIKQEIEV